MSLDAARRLEVALGSELALYERMRDLLQEEREVLLALDTPRLDDVTRRKAELADEGRVLESGRQAVVGQVAQELGIGVDGLRLSMLCDRLGPGAESLRAVHNRMVVVLGVVRELLGANQALAGQSLAEVRATLEAFGGLLGQGAAYGRDGSATTASGQLLRSSA